ncbi:MAG: magnesium transporter [Nanoarchaeota archaeon]
MGVFNKRFEEIFSAQLVSIIGGLIAGTILAVYKNHILLIPGMFILLPGFLEMRGNISGTLASRLSSGLFLKVIKINNKNTRLINANVFASFFLAFLVSFVLGLIAALFNYLVFGSFTSSIILLAVIAGVIANLIEIPLTLFTTFYLFKKGFDPNDIMGPFITSTGDVISILSILLALLLI